VESLQAAHHRLAVVDLSLGHGDFHNQDGLHLLDAVRRIDPGCVTIMLTGFATVELAVSALSEHGAFTCLRKENFNRTEFRKLVDRALASAPPAGAVTPGPDDHPGRSPLDRADIPVATQAPAGRVLVVEDDAGWRSILSELLADAGYEVCLCSSFGEALGRLRREKVDLAVVDLSLSGSTVTHTDPWHRVPVGESLEGYRLLANTRAAAVPTIVVSGVATPGQIERAYAEHAIFAFVEKRTFDRRVFLQTVEEARRAAAAGSELDCLTRREREVLELLAQGLTNKEIAAVLFITTNTVKRHLKAIFAKLDVHTRSAAAARAISAGIPIERSDAGIQAP